MVLIYSNDPAVDIVLIHGLLGGAFHTWRQKDQNTTTTTDYTSCWPEVIYTVLLIFLLTYFETWCTQLQSWLPQDLPNIRVVSVEYDTHLSDWMSHCPHQKETRTISFRSQQILEKLRAAGVGQKRYLLHVHLILFLIHDIVPRPVIWIAHSMGGLVLKNMLLVARDRNDELVNNTK